MEKTSQWEKQRLVQGQWHGAEVDGGPELSTTATNETNADTFHVIVKVFVICFDLFLVACGMIEKDECEGVLRLVIHVGVSRTGSVPVVLGVLVCG